MRNSGEEMNSFEIEWDIFGDFCSKKNSRTRSSGGGGAKGYLEPFKSYILFFSSSGRKLPCQPSIWPGPP